MKKRLYTKQNNFADMLCIGIFLILILLILSPEKYIDSVKNGIQLFFVSVLPSLFPFFVFTKLFTSIRSQYVVRKENKIIKKLFGLPPSAGYIFLLSALSGYPIGVKLITDMYIKGEITFEEAKAMTSFCSTSGPFFIIGTVGTTMFGDARTGYLLLIFHLLSSLICGLIFCSSTRKRYHSREIHVKTLPIPSSDALSQSVYDAILSVMTVGGFITVFYMLSDMLLFTGILSPLIFILEHFIPRQIAEGILFGIIEVTRGCKLLSAYSAPATVCIACGLISFGGISISLQAISYLKKIKIKARTYLLYKTVHAILAILMCACYYALKGLMV